MKGCESILYVSGRKPLTCTLIEGHKGSHENGGRCWDSTSAETVAVLALNAEEWEKVKAVLEPFNKAV